MPTVSWVLGTSQLGKLGLSGDRVVPTQSAVFGVSIWDQAQYTADDNLYDPLKAALDVLNNNKKNNVQDALIAETAIKNGGLSCHRPVT